jgi:XTP/dITP diphosphohydrolase
MRLVIASFNAGKRRELERLFTVPGLELATLAEFPGARAPEETGDTLLENARVKALAAVRLTGLPAIADDTGLEVDALGGRPGVRSARYAGPGATDAENVALLLAELSGVPAARRGARFRTVCVVVHPEWGERVGEGVLEGRIATAPRGDQGFGYDPVFEVEGRGATLAELPLEQKNALSHRARAVRDLERNWFPAG